MPELPEVETIRRSLRPVLVGRRIDGVAVHCAALRWPLPSNFSARLDGRTIEGLERRAKFLIARLDEGECWIIHFGMSGSLVHSRGAASLRKHDHVVIRLDDDGILVFNDPRRFGSMRIVGDDDEDPFAGIGPEPLDASMFDGEYLFAQGRKTRRSVKDVLMDQRVVAGLGNIYVNEALFLAGVRPRRALRSLSRSDCVRLVDCVRTILSEAIEHRGTTLSDFLDGIGRRGGYQWRRRVYDRAGRPCPVCGRPIKLVIVGQRSTFYCPSCQR